MAKVYLSPSNHGTGQNKCLKTGCYEDKHTRPIAEACAKYLRTAGVEVKVALAETSVMNGARTKESNAFGADLYVPIHTNAAGTASARYLMFMFWADNSAYRKIYNAVSPHVEAVYPGNLKAKFAVREDLYEIKSPKAKTMYCELGFHTNQTDCDSFIHNPEKVGKALADGICAYFGITPEKEEAAKPILKGTEEIAKEVIAGKWGNGNNRKSKLTAAGYDYNAVQAKVNELLGAKPAPKPSSKPVPKIPVRGRAVRLRNCPLYATATSGKVAGYITGTYYLWDGKLLNNRYRITNAKNRVGVAGQVTGYIDKSNI